MRYLIVLCNINPDSVVSMYLYYNFILNAGFEVSCYITNENLIKDIMKEKDINFKITNIISKDDKIIVLNNNKFVIPENINNDMVTEVISLRNGDFSKFHDANIKVDDVYLLITVIIERYREYKINIATDICKILQKIFNDNISKLSDRDKIALDYINILCKDIT